MYKLFISTILKNEKRDELNEKGSNEYYYYSSIVDFGEFLIAISITAQQDPKKKLEWAFSMYGMLTENRSSIIFDPISSCFID